MAKVYGCDGCGEEQAITLVQNVETGETLLFGPRCLLTWAEGMVAALQDVLGTETPAGAGEAATDELGAGADTPGAAVAGPEGSDPAALSPGNNLDNEAMGGGGNDERVRTPDPGTPGVHPVRAGAPGADDAGVDQLGGREGGSGVAVSDWAGDGSGAAGQRAGAGAGAGSAGHDGLDAAGAADDGHLAGTGPDAGRELTAGA